jgi:hypothetical protein
MEPLDDKDLNQLLRSWKGPETPSSLGRRVLPVKPSGWRWLLRGSIRIPVPLGIAAIVVLAGWMLLDRKPAPGPVAQPTPESITLADFQPVHQLEPRILGKSQERKTNESIRREDK